MAVLENSTNNYYKINFDSSSIRGLKVYVVFSVYESQAQRDKEKQRHSLIAYFGDKLQKYRVAIYEELVSSINKLSQEERESIGLSGNKIDAEHYPELRAKQDFIYELEEFIPKFYAGLYQYGKEENEVVSISEHLLEVLNEKGYNEEWLIDPIYLSMGAEVECGDYLGEEINHELFYNRLKTVMSQDIADC